jgi:LemA protein
MIVAARATGARWTLFREPRVTAILFILGLAAVVVFAVVGIYNRLVGLRNRGENAWSDIQVQLKRRHNLVGNLVETVKGYATHEQSTLEKVVQARNQAMSAGDAKQSGQAESFLASQLRQIFALAEAYPDLKANENFQELQRTLTELETEIQNARRYYNAVVRDFNTRIQSIPDVFVANAFGFKERDYFELDDPSEAAVPKVEF